jgi:HTH-type transcriptional regulator / antitoxin HigA
MEGVIMSILDPELAETIQVWPIASKVLATLETEAQYHKAVKWLDELIDQLSENEDPLVESLIDTLGTLVKDYEDRNVPESDADGIGCLKFLMEEHNLTPGDLPEIGSRDVVSDILDGKQPLDVNQIRVLSERFDVSPAVFI